MLAQIESQESLENRMIDSSEGYENVNPEELENWEIVAEEYEKYLDETEEKLIFVNQVYKYGVC